MPEVGEVLLASRGVDNRLERDTKKGESEDADDNPEDELEHGQYYTTPLPLRSRISEIYEDD